MPLRDRWVAKGAESACMARKGGERTGRARAGGSRAGEGGQVGHRQGHVVRIVDLTRSRFAETSQLP
eukprot:13306755-Alexandrium_andersonii.AAC.1